MKKCKLITFMLLCMILLNSVVYANAIDILNSNNKNNILNDDIKFTKKIVNYNEEEKEIEIELLIKNMKKNIKDVEEIEVAIVLDNSSSMQVAENNSNRKEITYNATNKFIELLYENIMKLEVGVTQYSTNANIISDLTDKESDILNSLETYKNTKTGGSTNTHIALETAKTLFENECKNKVIVLVTDGYPNYPDITKQELEKLEQEGIYVLSVIVSKEENVASIQNVFGTEEKPTAGAVYYIEDSSQIEIMFNDYIYKQIVNYMEHPITNVKIEDVFPEELLKYFDIEYLNIPTGTSVSEIGDKNSFVWSIDELTGEQVATFRYKVKLKKGIDPTDIIGVELKTNEKVIINYEDNDGKQKQEIFDKNPAIRVDKEILGPVKDKEIIGPIIEVKYNDKNKDQNKDNKKEESNNDETNNEEKKNNQEYIVVDFTPKEEKKEDNTQITPVVNKTTDSNSKNKLPQTGVRENIIIALIGVCVVISACIGIRIYLVNKDTLIIFK